MKEQDLWGKEIQHEAAYSLGKSMTKDLPRDLPSLTTVFGANLLVFIPRAPTGITLYKSDIEKLRSKFINFHNERPTPNIIAQAHMDHPELYDGYIYGLQEEGLINIYKNLYVENIKIVLSEKGLVEANLFRQFFELENAREDLATQTMKIEDIKEAGKDAAEARFKFYKKKVKNENMELTDDEKLKIVLAGRLLFDDSHVLYPNTHLKIRLNEQELEKYRQLSIPRETSSQP